MVKSQIIIHGGFFSELGTSAEIKKAKQLALSDIAKRSFEFLRNHTALQTVVHAVEQLEDDDLFNAGTGSQIQGDGKIRMSASIMDGNTQRFSGVINIEGVKNPICVAERLLHVDDRVLGGEGATKFARNNGFEYFNTETRVRRKEYEEKLSHSRSGTVGCVALDRFGNLATATSTGGKGFEIPGRISDSATVAGNFANAHCAVSCTGVGEDIVSGAIAAKIVTRVTDGMSLQLASEKTFAELKPFDGFAGAIAIAKNGTMFHLDSHPTMVFASYDGERLCVFD